VPGCVPEVWSVFLAIQRIHSDLATQGCLGDVDAQVKEDIILAATEEGMGLDVQYDIQIAGRATTSAGFALAREANARIVIYAGGISTDSLRVRSTRCSPWHSWHGVVTTSPVPPQRGHV